MLSQRCGSGSHVGVAVIAGVTPGRKCSGSVHARPIQLLKHVSGAINAKGTLSRKTVGVVTRSAGCQGGSARAVCASAQRTKGQEGRVAEHSGGINDP
jgi:hypothetical protein